MFQVPSFVFIPGGELEPHKVLYVVEDALALLDGAQDGGEVVVEQHHVGRLLAHVGAWQKLEW